MHILFVFVDGIGLGENDPAVNPFADADLPGFGRLSGGEQWVRGSPEVEEKNRIWRAADPRLDTEGLPQSGTGQATLFTGENCARIAGRHYGPYPHSKTRPVLAEKNLFTQVRGLSDDHPRPTAFANAYPERFFEYVKRTDRWTVTTRCCLESSTRIRSTADLRAGRAVPADLVGRRWPEPIENDVMPTSERDAARRLLRITSAHRLTLFEYYLTDKAGHRQDKAKAARVLKSLDALLAALVDEMDASSTLLVLTSDHGNLEDLSVRTHTLNDVPFAAFGAGADALGGVQRLEDVTPALVRLLRS